MGSSSTLTLSFTLKTPHNTPRICKTPTFSPIFLPPTSTQLSNHGSCSWESKKRPKFSFLCTKINWVHIISPKEFVNDEFVVVNFYRFVFVDDPEEEVAKHLLFLQVIVIDTTIAQYYAFSIFSKLAVMY